MGSKTTIEYWCDSCGKQVSEKQLIRFISLKDADICFDCINQMVKAMCNGTPNSPIIWRLRRDCPNCHGKGYVKKQISCCGDCEHVPCDICGQVLK